MTFAPRLRIPTLAAAALLCLASAAQAQNAPAHPHSGAHPHGHSQPHAHERGHGHGHGHDSKHHKEHHKEHPKGHAKGDGRHAHGQHGHPSTKPAMNAFEKNALRRCEVFKTDVERNACAARVRAPVASGSVAGGGVLREHVITVPVAPQ